MMTDQQKQTLEKLRNLHAARKLKRSQGVLLASLERMDQQEKFNTALSERTAARNDSIAGGE